MMSKKNLLYEAAMTIMIREGVNGLTISKVANEANIGKSTVYEYFNSKDELIYKTINYMGEKYVEQIQQKLFTDNKGFEITIKGLIRIIIATIRQGNTNFIFMISECDKTFKSKVDTHEQIKNIMLGIRMKLYNLLEEIIDLGVNEGIIDKPKDKMTFVIWQNLLVILSYEFSGEDVFLEQNNITIGDDEENINTIYNLLLKVFRS
ncbi:TetR/AcrR family transcriptional regulator [Vallitalea sp.]|jgi:AcrR family transcriptional regulator|uniref:TetR/AcrR family transcriptional regulator n=1 Tax=Vallitalea sp. TaxID=1882829 RepID=UPI0025D2931E|nr:TetR/AcrR family transcriptional regulator [Vallitalea sp.]MCT4686195.1 TetR/AcrR family transcriptional regulator [Vallitalea sp.]